MATLQQISRQTFAETFAASNTEENMRKYLDEAYSLEKLAEELKAPDVYFYFAKEEVANELNAEYVWLGVWEENTRAIGFYERQGFVAFDKHIFRLGQDEQTDIMMKRPVEI